MKARLDGPSYICECGTPMIYLETIWDAPQRRMVCAKKAKKGCKHEGVVFLEPTFDIYPLPQTKP
jgi:hypothetical protein